MSDNQRQNELICAFLDEELPLSDIDALLAHLECENARAKAWRQAMVGDVMASRAAVRSDISSAVMAAVRKEAVPTRRVLPFNLKSQRHRSGKTMAWWVPASGVGLAASVALAAVVLVNSASDQPASGQIAAAIPDSVMPVVSEERVETASSARELVIASPTNARPIVAQWSSADAPNEPAHSLVAGTSNDVQERLNTYLINHARYGGGYALSGSLAYARVAASPHQVGEPGR
jgi:negative regulator of sigma E activity